MIVSASTEVYNQMFLNNYNYLLKWAYYDADNLHSSYLKMIDVITNGFTAHTESELPKKLREYTKTVIYSNNEKTREFKLKNKKIDVGWEAEQQLSSVDDDQRVEILEKQQTEVKTIYLFNYLKQYHSQEDNWVFRVYYLYDKNNKKITYKQLSEITGFSISKVCGIIQKIKADLKLNLNSYINNGNT